MVTSVPVPTSHTFYLLMCLFTCGFWAPVWLVVAILNRMSKRKQVTRIR
jgi:hypothetical protein